MVVASREPDHRVARQLHAIALDFVFDSFEPNGRCRNRMDRNGKWTDRGSTDDCWGRAVFALGTTVAGAVATGIAAADTHERALRAFDRALTQRSAWPRAMAFAALGAADVLAAIPSHAGAKKLLIDALNAIGPAPVGGWTWPERRLTYANATLAEAVLAAGHHLGREGARDRGLAMLSWLLAVETRDGHLSVTGIDGRGPNEAGPQFDQQPIEVSALADACWRASIVTSDPAWGGGVAAAAAWFEGGNDTGAVMHDVTSGGGYDGLRVDGVNTNQGAESTLAYVSTMQRARSFATIA